MPRGLWKTDVCPPCASAQNGNDQPESLAEPGTPSEGPPASSWEAAFLPLGCFGHLSPALGAHQAVKQLHLQARLREERARRSAPAEVACRRRGRARANPGPGGDRRPSRGGAAARRPPPASGRRPPARQFSAERVAHRQ